MNRKLIEKVDALLEKEKGTVYKDPGGKTTICLLYPNTYHVGMSNLGFQGIYGLLNRREDVVCERAFLPSEEDIGEYTRTNTPLFSFESKKPINRFDIVAFSLSFENDYPNIVKMLSMARIPLTPEERGPHDPLVIAGGVGASFNPEPVAPMFDLIFIGDAEESLLEFLDLSRQSLARDELKRRAAEIQGIYVPELYSVRYNEDGTIAERIPHACAPDHVIRRTLKDLSLSPITTSIITPESEFSGMYLVEVMRGCPWSCKFCLVGQLYNPPRKKEIAHIESEIERAKALTGRVGLIGPSLTDYPAIKELLCIDNVSFSITSLRASERSAELVKLMKGNKSVSIAPEAGTERMRKVINKRITEKDILNTAQLIFESGIETLRLYFMIGLPTETEDDITGIIELVTRIRGLSKRGMITASVSTFVPKPFTPFQWHPMEPLDSIKKKLKTIKAGLRDVKGVKVFHDVPKYAHMQGLFARGDRRLFPLLKAMAQQEDYRKAAAEAGVPIDFYIFRKREFGEILPWDFIDIGIPKEKLWESYRESLRNSL